MTSHETHSSCSARNDNKECKLDHTIVIYQVELIKHVISREIVPLTVTIQKQLVYIAGSAVVLCSVLPQGFLHDSHPGSGTKSPHKCR